VTVYTGDMLLSQNRQGDWDINFENGQPEMTNGLETYVMLAVFGADYWGNAIETDPSNKMISEFPGVIERNVVTEKTKNDGVKAIEKALSYMIIEKIARKITVTGEIQTNYRIVWQIDIESITDKNVKYYINWEKGVLTADMVEG
jgi:hypothetical protein